MNQDKPALRLIREFVAVGRATFERPYTSQGDPNAQRKIVEGIEILDDQGVPLEVSGPLVELLAPRATFFDQCVLDAIDAGVTQIVNIGAGYDDRALRFRHPDIQFFEIDLPHVIDDKFSRLNRIDDHGILPTLIPADLRDVDIAEVLIGAGFATNKPALFVCEHVILFLERRHVDRLFSSLSQIAAPGSDLVLTLEVHPDGLDSALVVSTVDEVMFDNVGLLYSIRSREDWIAGLRALGWIIDASTKAVNVDHFAIPLEGETVQIQTQFMKAIARRLVSAA